MDEEQLNRKMEFIVEQQAQFMVDIHKLEEGQKVIQARHEELAVKHSILADALLSVVGMVGKLTQGQEELRVELAASQKRTDERLVETNERLNIFIDVLERYISEGRNGRKPDAAPPEN